MYAVWLRWPVLRSLCICRKWHHFNQQWEIEIPQKQIFFSQLSLFCLHENLTFNITAWNPIPISCYQEFFHHKYSFIQWTLISPSCQPNLPNFHSHLKTISPSNQPFFSVLRSSAHNILFLHHFIYNPVQFLPVHIPVSSIFHPYFCQISSMFHDFISIFQTFSRSGKLLGKLYFKAFSRIQDSAWALLTVLSLVIFKAAIKDFTSYTSASLCLSCPGCFFANKRMTSGVLKASLMAAWMACW